jgi:imidazole glycerol-phosphate synthase subunit HisH
VTRVAILDYGMGNLRSVEKAFERVGAEAERTHDPAAVRSADGLVLPGVGAFPRAMARIEEIGLDELVAECLERGTPVLGICLGYQLLFGSSGELGGAAGLALVEGTVRGLEAGGRKVPHMGWEPVRWERESELTHGIESDTPFYFVHSFTPVPGEAADVVGTAQHGERFACVIARPPVFGVQFHPEKSSDAGLRLLGNFTSICAGTSRLTSGEARLRPTDSASQPAG